MHDDMQQTHLLSITVAYHLAQALTVSMSYTLLLAKTSKTMHHATCSIVSILDWPLNSHGGLRINQMLYKVHFKDLV